MRRFAHLALLLAFAACGKSEGTAADAAPEEETPDAAANAPDARAAGADARDNAPDARANAPDAAPAGGISGHWVFHYIDDTRQTDVPVDLTAYDVSALVKQGGSFTAFPGSGRADGTFIVPGVPAGEYYLRLQLRGSTSISHYDVRADRTVAYDPYIRGRSDARLPTMMTKVIWNFDALDPWGFSDVIELSSMNAGAVGYSYYADAQPAIDAVSIHDYSLDWVGQITPLINGAAGDRAYAVQLHGIAGDDDIAVITRSVLLPSFTMVDGQQSTLTATLAAVAQNGTFHLDVRAGDFGALRASVNPTAVNDFWVQATLSVLPGYDEHGFYGSAPDLVIASVDSTGPNLDRIVNYGNPYPAAWDLHVTASQLWAVKPAGGGGPTIFARATMNIPYSATAVEKPRVGPPLAPKVNGLSAFVTQTGVTLTPTLSWSAPAVGAPDAYYVTVYRLSGTTATRVVRFDVDGTSVTVPAGILQSGQTYAALIGAHLEVDGGPGAADAELITFAFSP